MHIPAVNPQGIQRLYEEGEEAEEPDEGIEGGVEEEEEEEEQREKECRDSKEGLCDRTQSKDQPSSERRSRRLKSEVGANHNISQSERTSVPIFLHFGFVQWFYLPSHQCKM